MHTWFELTQSLHSLQRTVQKVFPAYPEERLLSCRIWTVRLWPLIRQCFLSANTAIGWFVRLVPENKCIRVLSAEISDALSLHFSNPPTTFLNGNTEL